MRGKLIVSVVIFPFLTEMGCQSPIDMAENVQLEQTIEADKYFTFSLPASLHGDCGLGTDSFIGDFRSESLLFWFDLGAMPGNPGSWEGDHKRQIALVISHRLAVITFVHAPGEDSVYPYWSGMRFETVCDTLSMRLTMGVFGTSKASQDTALAIFRSVRFTM